MMSGSELLCERVLLYSLPVCAPRGFWLWLWLYYTTLKTALHHHRYAANCVGKPEYIGWVRGFEGMYVGQGGGLTNPFPPVVYPCQYTRVQ